MSFSAMIRQLGKTDATQEIFERHREAMALYYFSTPAGQHLKQICQTAYPTY